MNTYAILHLPSHDPIRCTYGRHPLRGTILQSRKRPWIGRSR